MSAGRRAAAALVAAALFVVAPPFATRAVAANTVAAPQAGDDQPPPPPADAPKFIEKTTERGPVKARVRLEPASPVIGDAITLTLEVTAADGIELSMPEFGQSLDRFSVREFVPKQSVDAQGNQVATQRYVLEPPLSGPQSIPPLMIEFVDHRPGQRPAPEGEQSYELVTERIPFEVQSVVPQGASPELKPVRGHLAPLRTPGPLWPWLVAVAALAAVAGPYAWKKWKAARVEGRRRTAWELARARLDVLASRTIPTAADEVDVFFVELSALIRRYLEDRFELRAPELTTEEFLQIASASPDLVESQQGFLREFLRSADMVKFARFVPEPDDIRAALAAASRFLDETHRPGDTPDAEAQAEAQAANSGAARAA